MTPLDDFNILVRNYAQDLATRDGESGAIRGKQIIDLYGERLKDIARLSAENARLEAEIAELRGEAETDRPDPSEADLAAHADQMGEHIRQDTQRAIERFDEAAAGAGWAVEREGPDPPVTIVDALLSFGLGFCAILTGLALLRFAGPQMVVPTAIGCLLGVWAMVVGARQLAREWRTR